MASRTQIDASGVEAGPSRSPSPSVSGHPAGYTERGVVGIAHDDRAKWRIISRNDRIRRAVQESHDIQHPALGTFSIKGKERAYDFDGERAAAWDKRAVSAANMLPIVATTASSAPHHASARLGAAASAAPAASSAVATSGGTHAVQSTPVVLTSSSAATSVVSSLSSSASQAPQSSIEAPITSSSLALSSSVLTATPTNLQALAQSTASPSATESLASSTSPAMSNQPSQTSTPLSKNTPVLVVIIVGSIVAAATVLYGMAWLCRRSGRNRRSRARAARNNWSPRGEDSQSDFATMETSEIGAMKRFSSHFQTSPIPALKTDEESLNGGVSGQNRTLNHVDHLQFKLAAPHQINTPAQLSGPLVLTGSMPSRDGRGWALYDQPLPVASSRGSDDKGRQDVRHSSDGVNPPRRPTFVQKAIAHPSRGSTVNVDAKLSRSEQAASASSHSEQGTKSGPTSRSNTTGTAAGGLLAALSSTLPIPSGTGPAKERYTHWPAKSFRRKSTNIPIDSDFEGTIGAPDKEVPRAVRVKKGHRFVCEASSGSSAGEESDFIPDESVTSVIPRQRAGAVGMLSLEAGATPRTPGVAGVGASWARASAQMSRYPALASPDVLPDAPGRQLLGAPGLPPRFAQHPRAVSASFAELRRQQAIIDDAEQRQRRSIPQQGDPALTSKVASWWNGSWDAEWPSPTESARRQSCAGAAPMSPKSLASSFDTLEEPGSQFLSSQTFGELAQTPSLAPIEDPSLLRAQDSLKRMSSLRPRFAAVTSLASWLDPNGPPAWRNGGREDDIAEGDSCDEDVLPYQGSLKSPVMKDIEVRSDPGTNSDLEDFPMRHKTSRSSFSILQESPRVPIDGAGSEASLPSYHSHAHPMLQAGDGVGKGQLIVHGDGVVPLAVPFEESGAEPLKSQKVNGTGAWWKTGTDVRDLSMLQKRTRSKLDSRKRRKGPGHIAVSSAQPLSGEGASPYIDSEGFQVRHVGVNMAVQPLIAQLMPSEVIEGQSSDISDYETEKLVLGNFESPKISMSSPQVYRAPLFTGAVGKGAESYEATRFYDRHREVGPPRRPIGSHAAKRLVSAPHRVDILAPHVSQEHGDVTPSKVRVQRGASQRRIVSTGCRPRPRPLQRAASGSESPTSSSDSDISVRRWGTRGSFQSSDLSEPASHRSSVSATSGAIADWNMAKKRRSIKTPRGRHVSAGIHVRY